MTIQKPGQGLKPSEYGTGLGPYQFNKDPDPIEISFADGGLNVSQTPVVIGVGESPDTVNVDIFRGGLTPFRRPVPLGTQANSLVLGLAGFQKQNGIKMLVRFRQSRWDRWNGATWLPLQGSIPFYVDQRVQAVVMEDRLIVANGASRLLAWDGVDTTPVVPLSDDAPIAKFVTRFGERLWAAVIRPAASLDFDPYAVACSEDGNIFGWTNVVNGAGFFDLSPQGPNTNSQFITGLSALERALVVYRQRSIMLGTLTGTTQAPVRFSTVDYSHGTESPYSIANGGLGLGDFYLGQDLMPYMFDGAGPPTPIGDPIYDKLITEITHPDYAVGFVDTKRFKYWLFIPTTDDKMLLTTAYVFDIRSWVTKRRLVWTRYTSVTGNGITGVGFAISVPLTSDPIVDTVTDIVDTVNKIVDSFATDVKTTDSPVFAGSNGQIYRLDDDLGIMGGYYLSKEFSIGEVEMTVDNVRMFYQSKNGAVIGLALSSDGGLTFGEEQFYYLTPVYRGIGHVSNWFMETGDKMQFMIRFVNGDATISKLLVSPKLGGLINK